MTLQLRPGGGSGDKRMYAPNRDLAWCFPQLAQIAFDAMGEADWETWYGDYLRYAGATEQDIGNAAEKLAAAIGLFLDESIKSPHEALDKSGFLETNRAAQVASLAKIGQIIVGAFFIAIRDVTLYGEEKPAVIVDLENAGKELHRKFEERYANKPAQSVPEKLS